MNWKQVLLLIIILFACTTCTAHTTYQLDKINKNNINNMYSIIKIYNNTLTEILENQNNTLWKEKVIIYERRIWF